jgi:hypothetical protein
MTGSHPSRRRTASRTACLAAGAAALLVLPLSAAARPTAAHAHESHRSDAVTTWNANAGKAALAACIAPSDDPLHESRMYAMTHLAIHDALNAIDRRYAPYASDFRAPADSSVEAAVAAAARGVLVATVRKIPAPFPASCRAAGLSGIAADYAAALTVIPDGAVKRHGIAAGERAAGGILAKRSGDGSDTPLIDATYRQGTRPGAYRFTPGSAFAFAPGWGRVTPFVLSRASQFRPAPPYEVSSRRYAKDVNEVKRLGGDGVTTPTARTKEQTEIALFWLESSPLSWNRIARSVATDRHLDAWEQARLFALLNLSMTDGYIGSFETKYRYALWRPVTAIQQADKDGNPATTADPGWKPLRPTPAIPDYDSAHSVEGAAAAGVMRRFFGSDRIRFNACSRTLPARNACTGSTPVRRTFSTFSQAAHENAESRILIGFHFRAATEVGLAHGDAIAERATDRFLRPVR